MIRAPRTTTYKLLIAWVLLVTMLVALCANEKFWMHNQLKLIRGTGLLALLFFLLTLLHSPIRQILRKRPTKRQFQLNLRRSLGLVSATAALVHSALALLWYYPAEPWFVPLLDSFSRFGIVAMLTLVPLWITSFPTLNRGLRLRHWAALHSLIYLSAILIAGHALLAPFGSAKWTLLGIGLVVGIRILGHIVTRTRFKPTFAKKRGD